MYMRNGRNCGRRRNSTIIAESDSDWASESDDSFETSLESDSSVPDKKPEVTVHRDSASRRMLPTA